MKVNHAALVFYVFLSQSKAQYPSPCPNILRYEDREFGRWFASLSLVTSEDLNGVWVEVELDLPAEELASKFGKTTVLNPKKYLIENDDFQMQSRKLLAINISAKYDGFDVVPSVVGIKLNGRLICDNSSTTITTTTIRSTTTTTTTIRSTTTSISSTISEQTRCGTISNTWRWSWAVIIVKISYGYTLENFCGGVLISDWHVLTTSDCVSRPFKWNPQQLFVYLGTDRLEDHGLGYQLAQVAEIYRYPNSTRNIYVDDLAVLKLSKAVERTDYVTPLCFPEENNIIGKTVTLLRFIKKGDRVSQEELKVPITAQETCYKTDTVSPLLPIVPPSFPETFCGRYTNDSFSGTQCERPKGFGLVSESPDGLHWRLHGVHAGTDEDCGINGYLIFVNVTHYVSWLKAVTGFR